MILNAEEIFAAKSIAKQDERLNYNLRMLLGQIIYTINLRGSGCYTHNSHFAKNFNRSERTIKRWLKILKDLGYISVQYIWEGTKIVNRFIGISAELFDKISDEIHKKTDKAENSVAKPNVPGNGPVINKVLPREDISSNEDIYTRVRAKKVNGDNLSEAENTTNNHNRESYWQLIDRKIPVFNRETSRLNELIKQHTKQRMLFRKAPTNYALELTIDSLFNKFRSMKNRIKAVEKAVKNGWINIGGGCRNKYKRAAFKANKTKHTEPCTTDYGSALPDVSYNRWDLIF
ncbi:MAG: helix-turn-helix domain-containing protein [Treponema sp.]